MLFFIVKKKKRDPRPNGFAEQRLAPAAAVQCTLLLIKLSRTYLCLNKAMLQSVGPVFGGCYVTVVIVLFLFFCRIREWVPYSYELYCIK